MELMQLIIFDELETQVVEKLVVEDHVKVRQEAIKLAEKSMQKVIITCKSIAIV